MPQVGAAEWDGWPGVYTETGVAAKTVFFDVT
jgi:hypothetical protein